MFSVPFQAGGSFRVISFSPVSDTSHGLFHIFGLDMVLVKMSVMQLTSTNRHRC